MNKTIAVKKDETPTLDWNPEQIAFIKRTVAPQADANEFQLFITRCKFLGLNPLLPGEIHFMKYGTSPGTIIVGIEGFRKRAQRTGLFAGIKREIIRDEKGKCTGARVSVWRKDWTEPATEEVSLAEYNTGRSIWLKMPETMIKKVAEVSCLRMAFSTELGGLYSHEEMDQATPISENVSKMAQDIAIGVKGSTMTADEYSALPEQDKALLGDANRANKRRLYAESKKKQAEITEEEIPVIDYSEDTTNFSEHLEDIKRE